MKSVVCHGAKDLRIEDSASPELNAGQVIIAVEAGGICGSDLHYYHNGGFGAIRIREPMVLGHEVSGRVEQLGDGVSGLNVGDLVAINPSRPCYDCEYCKRAEYNQCLEMRFYGSAMKNPHIQGAFSQQLVVEARQCVVLPEGTNPNHGAFAEPLSVGLHAINQAGKLMGKRVLVTGTGPIGALTVAAAKLHGALEVVATDVVDETLERVLRVGADKTVNVATNAKAMDIYKHDKGYFDVVIEASGNQAAMLSALEVIRPRGTLIQLGLGGDVELPLNTIVGKEINMKGSFRFHEEFAWAAQIIGSGKIDLDVLLTGVYPIDQAISAFEIAGDRTQSMKVQISFA